MIWLRILTYIIGKAPRLSGGIFWGPTLFHSVSTSVSRTTKYLLVLGWLWYIYIYIYIYTHTYLGIYISVSYSTDEDRVITAKKGYFHSDHTTLHLSSKAIRYLDIYIHIYISMVFIYICRIPYSCISHCYCTSTIFWNEYIRVIITSWVFLRWSNF